MQLISDNRQDLARYRLGLNCGMEKRKSKRFGTRVLLRTREPSYLGGANTNRVIPGSLLGQNLADEYWNTTFNYRDMYSPGFSLARWVNMRFGVYASRQRHREAEGEML